VVLDQAGGALVKLAGAFRRVRARRGRSFQPGDRGRGLGSFDRFSRASGHPARLNFGDCMAYAVAAVMRAPLLFKGGDFGLTDVMAHPASIRL
jgi:ribonuclease VapC